MRLLIQTSALVVTSTIAVGDLMLAAYANGRLHPWRQGALLLTVVAVAFAIASEMRGCRHEEHAAPAALVRRSPWAPLPLSPLLPFHVFFTLRHTTSRDLLVRAFPDMDDDHEGGPWGLRRPPRTVTLTHGAMYNPIHVECRESHGTMRLDTLALWLDRYTGFGEWPIKKPIEMAVEIRHRDVRPTDNGDVLRFRLCLFDNDVVVTGVHRVDDILFQDNTVFRWETRSQSARLWTLADLDGATVHIRAAYLSFDDINLLRPPRFHNLRLHFGAHVLTFPEDLLTSPVVQQDLRPLVHGPFFKTLVVEYSLTLTRAFLMKQLLHPGDPALDVPRTSAD